MVDTDQAFRVDNIEGWQEFRVKISGKKTQHFSKVCRPLYDHDATVFKPSIRKFTNLPIVLKSARLAGFNM